MACVCDVAMTVLANVVRIYVEMCRPAIPLVVVECDVDVSVQDLYI